jgi:hypothetical protein
MTYKTLHRKLKIEQTAVNSGAPEGLAVDLYYNLFQ